MFAFCPLISRPHPRVHSLAFVLCRLKLVDHYPRAVVVVVVGGGCVAPATVVQTKSEREGALGHLTRDLHDVRAELRGRMAEVTERATAAYVDMVNARDSQLAQVAPRLSLRGERSLAATPAPAQCTLVMLSCVVCLFVLLLHSTR